MHKLGPRTITGHSLATEHSNKNVSRAGLPILSIRPKTPLVHQIQVLQFTLELVFSQISALRVLQQPAHSNKQDPGTFKSLPPGPGSKAYLGGSKHKLLSKLNGRRVSKLR